MKSVLAAVFCTLVAFATPALATPSDPNPCGNHGNNCTVCSTPSGDVVSTSENACYARSEAEAEAECSARAQSDAFALAVCGNLNYNQQNQVCAPYVRNNIHSICAPEVAADADAYCGTYVANRVETEVTQRCGDAVAFCGGDHDFLSIALRLGDVSARCKQSQEQAQAQSVVCGDSSENSFNASQSCEQAAQTVSQAVSLQCPDIEAVCAKSVKRYRKRTVIDPLTGAKSKVFDTITKCVKWAKPVINFTDAQ